MASNAVGRPQRPSGQLYPQCYDAPMLTLRARVKNGRLVVDEPTDLPEGAEVELAAIEEDLDDDDRARLHAALDVGVRVSSSLSSAYVLGAL